MKLFVWWLSEGELRAYGSEPRIEPPAVAAELRSMSGRPLRGRLWSRDEHVDVRALFPSVESPISRYLERCGGIVISDDELVLLKIQRDCLLGIVTDLKLVRVL
jgi:hypothetical protein